MIDEVPWFVATGAYILGTLIWCTIIYHYNNPNDVIPYQIGWMIGYALVCIGGATILHWWRNDR